MDLPVEVHGETAVVAPTVENLDAGVAKAFKSAMAPVLEAHRQVILDMSRVEFMDSSGLGALISCLRDVTAKGGDLKLFGLNKKIRALFEMVRLHRLFEIYNTKAEALQAF
jgi:anti-sigma B factor antagonist